MRGGCSFVQTCCAMHQRPLPTAAADMFAADKLHNTVRRLVPPTCMLHIGLLLLAATGGSKGNASALLLLLLPVLPAAVAWHQFAPASESCNHCCCCCRCGALLLLLLPPPGGGMPAGLGALAAPWYCVWPGRQTWPKFSRIWSRCTTAPAALRKTPAETQHASVQSRMQQTQLVNVLLAVWVNFGGFLPVLPA